MAFFKCKMCGGDLDISAGMSIAECQYCGTKQTLPKLDDDKKATLYDRANHFRRNNEFDKAMGIYEQILNEDSSDAEAYWSLVLCRYGIEYVEDPASRKRIPTVNRAQFTSVFDDENYKSALQYADGYQRSIYEEEAKAINEIQKGILAISQQEEPFDVFICYKETDANGRRTPDSVLANDLYHQLTQEGFKVFFARITLEDKLGTAYEPYIFAALNSAKVMVVLGTKPEYFNAVWVRNEWSRYLALIKSGAKKMLIPAYKDMDPYDLPEEFAHLQSQDMSKLGFMQDLIRGIKKIASVDEQKTVVREVVQGGSTDKATLLKRASLFLIDGNWKGVNEYCEKVLDVDPECAEAYLYKLMAELHIKQVDNSPDINEVAAQRLSQNPRQLVTSLSENTNYKKAALFGNADLKTKLQKIYSNIESEAIRLEIATYETFLNTQPVKTVSLFLFSKTTISDLFRCYVNLKHLYSSHNLNEDIKHTIDSQIKNCLEKICVLPKKIHKMKVAGIVSLIMTAIAYSLLVLIPTPMVWLIISLALVGAVGFIYGLTGLVLSLLFSRKKKKAMAEMAITSLDDMK